jgi:hypothetical protein
LNVGLSLVLGLNLVAEALQVGLKVPELAKEAGAVAGLGVGQTASVIKLYNTKEEIIYSARRNFFAKLKSLFFSFIPRSLHVTANTFMN